MGAITSSLRRAWESVSGRPTARPPPAAIAFREFSDDEDEDEFDFEDAFHFDYHNVAFLADRTRSLTADRRGAAEPGDGSGANCYALNVAFCVDDDCDEESEKMLLTHYVLADAKITKKNLVDTHCHLDFLFRLC